MSEIEFIENGQADGQTLYDLFIDCILVARKKNAAGCHRNNPTALQFGGLQ